MQLAYLIPHIDAEIARLQKARDLLALIPVAKNVVSDDKKISDDTQAERKRMFASRLEWASPEAMPGGEPAPGVVPVGEPVPLMIEAAAAREEPQAPGPGRSAGIPGRMKTPRAHNHGEELRPGRRKRLLVLDTALRGPVPAGPVVVSAEEVRKSQAAKAAQATRAAEVKRAGSDFVSSFGWRSRAGNVNSVDALMQRLINIGKEEADHESVSPLSSLQQGDSFEAARVPLASKLD